MHTSVSQEQTLNAGWSRKIGYLLLPPLVTFAVLVLILAYAVSRYQADHAGLIYTGVSVGDIDLSRMTAAEAETALTAAFPYVQNGVITLQDANSGTEWSYAPADLGLTVELEETIQDALNIGRSGSPAGRLQEVFGSYYYGRSLNPTLLMDTGQYEAALRDLAARINQPATDATLSYSDGQVGFLPGEAGRELDTADLDVRLQPLLLNFQNAEIELLIHETEPVLFDDTAVTAEIQNILAGPMTFYLAEPLDDADIGSITLPQETLASWLRVDAATNGSSQNVIVDENAVRHWLRQYEDELYREPANARFYFDDDTEELVLVAAHINGRALDIDATLDQFLAQVGTANRAVPFMLTEIVPTVHNNATAAELGITELITSTTTWFYGSTDARKHNIARSAANFFGIVVAPGEEFSFNKYLGSISESDGYEEGLIIVGGRTIKGIGGGVCQVSTTLYQAAFLGGFPITERWAHGYMLGYYNDGQGPGMDATVYSPIVDTKFINNTPHHLLIENYYNEEFEALTFKFYSTDMGREVIKTEPLFTNETPAPEDDVWEFDPDLEPGTVVQIDWATIGADVYVDREVYNADGDLIIDETVVSNYIPYPNVFHYGPGVEPYDYSLVPDDN